MEEGALVRWDQNWSFWPRSKHIHVLEWPSQSPDLNPIENLWQDLKIAVHRHSPSSLTELELFCKEEWANISVSRCGSLVETYPKMFFIFENIWKQPGIIFLPLHNHALHCVGLSHEIPMKYIYVCGCNVTKCGKVQGVWTLFLATVHSYLLTNMHKHLVHHLNLCQGVCKCGRYLHSESSTPGKLCIECVWAPSISVINTHVVVAPLELGFESAALWLLEDLLYLLSYSCPAIFSSCCWLFLHA